MTVVDSLERHREALAIELRRLRLSARLSGTELANRLHWNQSRVSRYETGRQSPSPAEVQKIAEALGASNKELDTLMSLAKALETEWLSTRTVLSKGTQDHQADISKIEAKTKVMKNFSLTLIPGLLQTPNYTRALCQVLKYGWDEVDVNNDIELRQERQNVLKKKGKQFTFLLAENALWCRYGSAQVMREQLAQIQELSTLDNVKIGIIPRTAQMSAIPSSGFIMYDKELVSVELLTGVMNVTFPSDIAEYHSAFDALSGIAVAGRQAKRIYDEIEETLLG